MFFLSDEGACVSGGITAAASWRRFNMENGPPPCFLRMLGGSWGRVNSGFWLRFKNWDIGIAMTTRMIDPKFIAELSRYSTEELDPRIAEDEAAMAAFIARNRDAINKALEDGYKSLDAGKGTEVGSLEDLCSILAVRGRSRSTRVGSG
jgi:hypothetical protein